MSDITFVFFTYNEAKRLPYVLRNFKSYGPVIIMDGGSTDATEYIATKHGAVFLTRPDTTTPFVENQKNLNFLKEHMTTNWVYWGYCDNTAPKTLVEKMCSIARENRFKKVSIPLFTYLWGNTHHYAQKSYIPALFHKDYIDFSRNHIHGMGTFLGTDTEVLTLPSTEEYALRHFSTYNEAKFVSGYMRYGEEEARQKYASKEKFSVLKLCAAMVRYIWIFRRSFKNPRLGFLIALNMAFGRLMTYTRLYEYEHGITLDTIEDAYSKKKEELLKDF